MCNLKKIFFVLIVMLSVLITACSDDNDKDYVTNPNSDGTNENLKLEDVDASPDFDWSTSRVVKVNLLVNNYLDNKGFLPSFKIYDGDPNNGGKLLDIAVVNADGKIKVSVPVKKSIDKIVVIGLMNTIEIPIINNKVDYTYFKDNYSIKTSRELIDPNDATGYIYNNCPDYYSNSLGLTYENYTEDEEYENYKIPLTIEEVMSNYSVLNNLFQESVEITDVFTDLDIEQNDSAIKIANDVEHFIISFTGSFLEMDETSVGYYTFTGDEPTINELVGGNFDLTHIVAFNLLTEFDNYKFDLGAFSAGTKIGFVYIRNGWHSVVDQPRNGEHWYTTPVTMGSDQAVLLKNEESYYLGCEWSRNMNNWWKGDNDYNDIVIKIETDIANGIDGNDVYYVGGMSDQDGDGVIDSMDDFPTNSNKAYNTRSQGTRSFVLEDLWPFLGDYDFNDFVVDYNFFSHKNANGKITNIITDMRLIANGAKLNNSFGIKFPFNYADVASISVVREPNWDTNSQGSVINTPESYPEPVMQEDSDGKLIIMYIDKVYDWLANVTDKETEFVNVWGSNQVEIWTDGDGNENTIIHNPPFYRPADFSVNIEFSIPQDESLWLEDFNEKEIVAPYNPFICANGDRGHEIHLADYPPTSFMDVSLFQTGDDATVIGNKYYKSNDNNSRNLENYPWGIDVDTNFMYMKERKEIIKGYNYFDEWVESNGQSYPNWFDWNIADYTKDNNLYDNRTDWQAVDVMIPHYFDSNLPLPY